MSSPKHRRQKADSRSLESFVDAPNDAGVGEQECPNGEVGCPGPNPDYEPDGLERCFPCFLEADDP